jgi:hypothetical protein
VNDDSLTIPAPPPLVPLTSAHDLKDRTMRDYTRNAGLPGMPSDPREIEKLVQADLQLAENFERAEGPSIVEKQKPVESAEERAERMRVERFRLENLVNDPNTRVTRQAAQRLGPALDLPPELENSPKWAHALGRMRRVIEGASAPLRHPDGTPDFRSMTIGCGYPAGAYDWLSDWLSFDMREVWATRKHNPFFGMSRRDASLKFVARTMDICDRSSSTSMGGWWVK